MNTTTPIDKDDPRGLRAEVRRHLSKGRQPVPIPVGKKGPRGQEWHRTKHSADDHDPHGNVGLVLGPASGNLVNIDCDCREAVELAPLLLPATEMVSGRAARGRSHLWYTLDEALPTERLQDPDKHTIIEFRCGTGSKGFQTVVPPSIHPSGELYEWYDHGDPSRAVARDLLRRVKHVAAGAILARTFPEKGRHDFALALAGALCEAEWKEPEAERFVRAVCKVGGSDDADARAATVGTTYRRAEQKEPIVGFQALGKLVEARALRLVGKWLGLRSSLEQLSDDAYTKDELADLADAEGVEAPALARRWIVQRGTSYYVLTQKGYRGPYIQAELGLVIRQHLSRAPIRRFTYTANGNARAMSPSEIAEHCGSSVDRVIADLTIERSRYDAASSTMYEAVCPLRDLAPRFDLEVDTWMRLLGGEQADKLLDWIATAWDLSRQTSALYLSGPKGLGKGMIAHGLARLWTTGAPPELEVVVGSAFNSSLTRCPLVFGDEIARAPDSATLRSFIGSDGRTLSRKFVTDADLLGSPRLVLAGNRRDLLRFDREDFTQDDRDAIASRFLHIHCSPAAGAYLQMLGGRRATERWVRGDVIAQHAAWVALNRQVTPGHRFLVEGDARQTADALATQGDVRGLVAEAVCKALDQAAEGKKSPPGGFFCGGGRLLVNASWLHDNWNLFVGMAHRVPTIKRIGAALRGMSEGDPARVGARGVSRPLCYPIKLVLLLSYAEEVGIGDTERMGALVDGGMDPEGVVAASA